MKINLHINGSPVSIEVSAAVYLSLIQAKRKDENLKHEQRRHWVEQPFDENHSTLQYINGYQTTPED